MKTPFEMQSEVVTDSRFISWAVGSIARSLLFFAETIAPEEKSDMEKIGLVLVFACLLLAVPRSGIWSLISQDVGGGKKGGAMFFVELWQDADILRGSYCAVAMGGNRIDCDPPKDKAKVNIWVLSWGTQRKCSFSRITVSAWVTRGSDMGRRSLR